MAFSIGDDRTTSKKKHSAPTGFEVELRSIRYPYYGSSDPSREWRPDDARTICLADVEVIVPGVFPEDDPLSLRDIRVAPGKEGGIYINLPSAQDKLKKDKVDKGLTQIDSQRELYKEGYSVPNRVASAIRNTISEALTDETRSALTEKWLSEMDVLNPAVVDLFLADNPDWAGDDSGETVDLFAETPAPAPVAPTPPPAPVTPPPAPRTRKPRPMPTASDDDEGNPWAE